VTGHGAAGCVGLNGEPGTLMQMTRQCLVSIGFAGPTMSSHLHRSRMHTVSRPPIQSLDITHQPGAGSSELLATWALWLKDGNMTTVRDADDELAPCTSTFTRRSRIRPPSANWKSPARQTSRMEHGRHDPTEDISRRVVRTRGNAIREGLEASIAVLNFFRIRKS